MRSEVNLGGTKYITTDELQVHIDSDLASGVVRLILSDKHSSTGIAVDLEKRSGSVLSICKVGDRDANVSLLIEIPTDEPDTVDAPNPEPPFRWSTVPARFHWASMDADGDWYAWEYQPILHDHSKQWTSGGDCHSICHMRPSPASTAWRHSLTERPK